MPAPSPAFTLDDGRIRLGDTVFVYLERTLAPADSLPLATAPRAYGVAPIAVSPSGSVLASVGPGEAVWLGFQAVDPARPATVRVRVDRPAPLDAVTGARWSDGLSEAPRNYLVCPPDYCLPGLRGEAGFRLFGLVDEPSSRDVIEELTVLSYGGVDAEVRISLVTPAPFTRATGVVPDAIDPDSAYKGWRLP